MSEAGRKAILRLVESTPDISGPNARKGGGPRPPVGGGDDGIDRVIVAECAKLDLSDTDNGERLRLHFGGDLAFVAQAGKSAGEPIAWTGKYWDQDNGAALAMSLAQEIGPLIKLEAEFLASTPQEAEIIKGAEALAAGDRSAEAEKLRDDADEARDALAKRQAARRKFGISSRNAGKVEATLKMAGPKLRKPAAEFNADPLRLVTQTHTLRFVVEPDLDCPDPDIERKTARVEAVAAFDRAHYMTGIVPCDYDPEAKAPKWEAFLAETMPDADKRRTLQAFAGMGLLAKSAQKMMYHYGLGANGKSIFLSVVAAAVGTLCVGLPKETLTGANERGAGQAAPDLTRLFGKRMTRVDELKDGEVLREDLIKRMTGGDPMTVRNLFGGYFDFVNVATLHASGNGRPRIDGTDNGIWRRMLVMEWTVTIAPEKQRDFDEMVADLLTERSGILNWLIAGACDYLANGLFVARGTLEATAEYRAEMDPIGEFLAQCTEKAPGDTVAAGRLYEAYCAWARASSRSALSATKIGRRLSEVLTRARSGAVRSYVDIRLTAAAVELLNNAPAPAEPEGY